jgi:hypothetical protein
MGITIDKAKEMLRVTTQKGIRTAVHPISRRYCVNHLDLHSTRLAGQFYVDWLSAGTKSLRQNVGAFVYSNGLFTECYSAESNKQEQATTSLREFCGDVGVPERLKSNRAPEFCGRNTNFHKVAHRKGINLTYAEPESKNQISPVDVEIREIRKRTQNKLQSIGMSRDDCGTFVCNTRQNSDNFYPKISSMAEPLNMSREKHPTYLSTVISTSMTLFGTMLASTMTSAMITEPSEGGSGFLIVWEAICVTGY